MHIFTSYSSKNRDIVTQLATDIEFLIDDCTAWFDQDLTGRGGKKWWKEICAEIRKCDVFLIAYSPQIFDSEPCQREHQYARELGKPILPVQIITFDFLNLPRDVQEIQVVDYRSGSRNEQIKLRKSLKQLPPAPPLPANAEELEPEAPLNPVAVLRDQISNLTADLEQQRQLLSDIDFLDDDYAAEKPDLLRRLIVREDMLIASILRRAQDMLVRAGGSSATSRIEVVSSPPTHPTFKAGDRRTDDKGVTQVYVPAGNFLMGSTKQQVDDCLEQFYYGDGLGPEEARREDFAVQEPQHEVIVARPFWLDLTPITNESYAEFIKEDGYQNQALWTTHGWQMIKKYKKKAPRNYGAKFNSRQQPRVGVTWYESYAYCQWRGGRLPTEAEWEWVARGAKSLIYPWGDVFDPKKITYKDNAGGKTSLVDRDKQINDSWCGVRDMSGNVCEWMQTIYNQVRFPYPYREDDGRNSEQEIGDRVTRGGSWWSNTVLLRCDVRISNAPDSKFNDVGFRCFSPALA